VQWFTENPWPPFLICLVIAAGLFGRWIVERERRWLVASGAFLAVGGLVVLIATLIVTQRERVQAGVYGLAKAFAAGDGERCASFFSEQDQTERDFVRSVAGTIKIDGGIRITDLSVEMSSAESRATATFRASADARVPGYSGRTYTRWELTWQREADEWKIIRVRRFRYFGEGELPTMGAME
jgi:hypothetical protein